MNAMIAQLAREHPGALEGWQALVIPLYQEIVGPSERLLWYCWERWAWCC